MQFAGPRGSGFPECLAGSARDLSRGVVVPVAEGGWRVRQRHVVAASSHLGSENRHGAGCAGAVGRRQGRKCLWLVGVGQKGACQARHNVTCRVLL